LARAAVQGRLQ